MLKKLGYRGGIFEGNTPYQRKEWDEREEMDRWKIWKTFGLLPEHGKHYPPFIAKNEKGTFLIASYHFTLYGSGGKYFDSSYRLYLVYKYIGKEKNTTEPTYPKLILPLRELNERFRKRARKTMHGK